jgi:hypothetical protein
MAQRRKFPALAVVLACGASTCHAQQCTTPSGSTTCNAIIDFALAIDNSLSVVNITGDIAAFAQGFIGYFDTASDYARFSVTAFAGGLTCDPGVDCQAEVLQDLTNNVGLLDTATSNLGNQGPLTSIIQGLLQGSGTLGGAGSRLAARKLLLLLTDGYETHNPGGDAAAIAAANCIKLGSCGAPPDAIFAIGFGDANLGTMNSIASSPEYSFLGAPGTLPPSFLPPRRPPSSLPSAPS